MLINGYAIKNWNGRRYLKTRLAVNNGKNATVWVLAKEDAWMFRTIREARRLLNLVRADSRRPEAIHVVDRNGRIVV